MPNGHVTWFDTNAERGVIEHNGREYAVTGSQVPSHAQVAGAPVHFDIERGDDGDVAVNVTLREGSRTSHRTSNFGDLSGAHHPGDKGREQQVDLNELSKRRRAYADQPRLAAEDWVTLLARNEIDRLVELYAPDARIHEGERTVSGGHEIHRYLQGSALAGTSPGQADIGGDGEDRFTVAWHTLPGEAAAVRTTLQVDQGAIVEQWTEEAAA